MQIKFHKEIKDLAVTAVVRRGEQTDAPIRGKPAKMLINREEAEKLGAHMRLWRKDIEFLDATSTDHLFVELMHTRPDALVIEDKHERIQQFLDMKKPAREPLVTAFRRFCPLDDLEKYLLKPTQDFPFKKGKKDASVTFELAVAWLLGLCGFEVIWLGQTKHEVVREDDVERGSVDILAYYEPEKTALLVSCTIGTPKTEDVDNIKSLRRLLLDEVFKDTVLQVMPLIFSASPELSNKKREGVKVLDAGDIRGILNYIRQGDIPRALSNYFGFTFKPKT